MALYQNCPNLPFTNAKLAASVGLTVEDFQSVATSKEEIQKLAAEKNKKRQNSSSGATNGLASSLAFTPVQGIELVNPTANRDAKEGTETYFSQTAQFFQSAFS